jgi:hypothetical protein
MIFTRKRRVSQPPTWRRIVLEAAALVMLHFIAAQILARANLLEHLLSPGADSRLALGVTAMFMLLRAFTLVLAPGWVLARFWLFWTKPATNQCADARKHGD